MIDWLGVSAGVHLAAAGWRRRGRALGRRDYVELAAWWLIAAIAVARAAQW